MTPMMTGTAGNYPQEIPTTDTSGASSPIPSPLEPPPTGTGSPAPLGATVCAAVWPACFAGVAAEVKLAEEEVDADLTLAEHDPAALDGEAKLAEEALAALVAEQDAKREAAARDAEGQAFEGENTMTSDDVIVQPGPAAPVDAVHSIGL
jgi:hypothetical protein